MHNRGVYKNRAYFSNGDFSEGFQIIVYPNNVGENTANDGIESGWFEIRGQLLQQFNQSLTKGICQKITLKDDKGQAYIFSAPEVKMLRSEYIDHCLEKLIGGSELKKNKLIKKIGLNNLVKLVGQK